MKTVACVLLTLIFSLVTIMTTNNTQAATLKPHLTKEVLDNGMSVLVKEVPGSKVATVQIWVKAGSIYEGPDQGGITHLIEHMIFKGTEKMGAGDVAALIEGKGGRINAYTSFEQTVYHATLSARHWQTALDVLSDAVQNSIFDSDELEREKLVVLEEIGMRNDRPNVKLFQTLMSSSYTTHPYRLPVIGTVESVSSFTRDDIIRYMDENYHPENFTVVVVGAVRPGQVVAKVKALFGGLLSQKNGDRQLPEEPLQKGARLFQMEDDINQAQLAMALPISAFSDPDAPVLDIISGILGDGDTSRLYNELRNEKGLVYQVHASPFTPKYPGLFEIFAILDQANIPQAIEAVLTELFKLKYVQVEDAELNRVKHSQESDFIFNLERVEGQARVMGSFYFQTGDPREDEYLEQIRSVTREDIIRVANQYFQGSRLTAGYLTPIGAKVGLNKGELKKIVGRAEKAAKDSIPTSLLKNTYLNNVHRFELKNGIRLLVREDPQVPTVAIRAVFPGGLRSEDLKNNGAFAFISELLPKSTKDLSCRDMSLKIADLAGDVSGYNGRNTFGIKANFLSKFVSEGLEIVRDVLLYPGFDSKEAEKIRPELLAALKQQEDSLASVSIREFNKLIYQGHPYSLNTSGSEEFFSSASVKQLRSLYEQHAEPGKLVLGVAGNVKAEAVLEEVEKLFGQWQAGEEVTSEEEFLPPGPPDQPQFFNVSREKEQVHIVLGFIGTSINSEDRFAMEVLETVLSGQSGRLFTQLRDKQSLAYSLSCFFWPGLDTGSLGIHIGTSPDKKEEAIKSLWQELYKIRETPISKDELEKAKNVLIGHFELGLETHGSQALDVALMETYDLGQDFGKKYVHEVSQVTVEDVMEIARKYLLSDHYVLVTVGAE